MKDTNTKQIIKMNKMNIYELEQQFNININEFDIMTDDRLLQIKQIMCNKLSPTDRRVFIIYLNSRSYRDAQTKCNIDFRQIHIIVKRCIFLIQSQLRKINTKNISTLHKLSLLKYNDDEAIINNY